MRMRFRPFSFLQTGKDMAMNGKDEKRSAPDRKVVAEEAIPVVEETVDVARREREGRTVTVTTRPVAEQVAIAEPVTREQVEIERVPVDKVVETVPEVREEDDVTVIPVVEERLVVGVELVLKEEIRLRRTRNTSTEERVVELRKTEVDISG